MADFMMAYLGGRQPSSPEEGAAHRARWGVWLKELGNAVVNPGTPLGKSKIVSTKGVSDAGDDGLTGYSVIRAENLEAAVAIAKTCPFLEMGDLEVAEIKSMMG